MYTIQVVVRFVSSPVDSSEAIPAGGGITFSCSNKLGATLLLRAAASRADFTDSRFVHEYIVKHIDSWYDYAWTLGYGEVQAPEGSIVLIKGCDKTTSWAHATFAERSREGSVHFDGGYFNVGGEVRLQGSWARAVSAINREAPLDGRDMQATIVPINEVPTVANSVLTNPPNDIPPAAYFPAKRTYTVFARMYRIRRRSILGVVKVVTVEGKGGTSRQRQHRSQSVRSHSHSLGPYLT
jgi:hypothetical protein